MNSLLLMEYLTAGGLAGDAAEAELMPLGRSMRDAMLADLLALPEQTVGAVSVVGCAAAPVEGALQADPRVQVLAPWPGETVLQFLAREAPRHRWVWVVAPESGGLLARCQALVGALRWVGSSARALQVASSKTATLAAWAGQQVLTPADARLQAQARRWVVKPDDGAGAVETYRFDQREAAEAHAAERRARGEAVVLQPWVEGDAMSLSLLCRPAGATGAAAAARVDLLSLNRQRIGVGAGPGPAVDGAAQVRFDGIDRLALAGRDDADPRWPAMRQLAQATQRALPGLCGFVGIDLVWHPELGPVGIEVNARVSCAYVGLSGLLGRPLAGEILAAQGAVGTEGGRHPFGRVSTSVSTSVSATGAAAGASTGSLLGERNDVAA